MAGRGYIREQRHLCHAGYQEVDIYPVSDQEHRASARAKKQAAQRLVQANLNARNALRHFVQLLNTNFVGVGAVHVSLTYKDKFLPSDPEAAEHDLDLWLRRVAAALKKKGAEPAKYIAVTEYREEDGVLQVRYHHHVVMVCDLSRDELESLWRAPGRVKKGEEPESMGWVNADRVQEEQGSLEALAKYLTKYTNRKRRWKASRGLKQPERPRPNDGKYTKRSLDKIVRERLDSREYWEKQYPGWHLRTVRADWNDFTGWHVTVQLWRDVKRRN